MIKLDIQIDLIIFSLLFGMLYHAGIIFFDKYIHSSFLNLINSLGYVLLSSLLYVYNIDKIASGILHPYSLMLIVIGYYLYKPIEKILKKWYIKLGGNMKLTAQAKRRLLVFGTFSILIIVMFIYSTSSYINSLNSLKNETDRLNLLLSQLEMRSDDLKIEINKLQDPEYIAKYARENYDYSKNDELIIKINETNNSIDNLNDKQYGDRLILIISAIIFMMMIFIYIFVKSITPKSKKQM